MEMHITGVRWEEEQITHVEVNKNGVPVSLGQIYHHTAEIVSDIQRGKRAKSERPFYILEIDEGEPVTLFVSEIGYNRYKLTPETKVTIATLKRLPRI